MLAIFDGNHIPSGAARVGGDFADRASGVCIKGHIDFAGLTRWTFGCALPFFDESLATGQQQKIGCHARLLKANAGEVAERLNAAVC
ncbi:MAG: hypothetical protein DMG55_23085 [Acidobacteria bacterium]|nr:MAG: hypothetical protein DMG55_23085 [Acidobacteriota bacterium]